MVASLEIVALLLAKTERLYLKTIIYEYICVDVGLQVRRTDIL